MKHIKFASTLVLTLAGIVGGCAAQKPCGAGSCTSDTQLTHHIETQIAQHPELGSRVYVQTVDGVVYLSGFVAAGETKASAESVVSTIPGVTRIVDTLTIVN